MRILIVLILSAFIISCAKQDDHEFNMAIVKAVDLINKGELNSSIEILTRLEASRPDSAPVQYLLGTAEMARDVYDEKGNIKNTAKSGKPLAHFKNAVTIVPSNTLYGLSYAGALADMGRCEEALPIFEKHYDGLKKQELPSVKIIYVRYAQCLIKDGDESRAKAVLYDLKNSGDTAPYILEQARTVLETLPK